MSLDELLDEEGKQAKIDKLKSALPHSQIPEDKKTEVIGRVGPVDKTEIHRDEEGLYWLRDSDEGISVAVFAPEFARKLAETLLEDLEKRGELEYEFRRKGRRRDPSRT